jgi:hypothetical protein
LDSSPLTVLYHYTTSTALQSILKSNQLWPSLRTSRPRDVRYGEGQYFTDVPPGQLTGSRLSRLLIGNPFDGHRFTYFLAIDVTGLTIHQGRPGIFVIPNSTSLPLEGRIVRTGRNFDDLP